MRDNPTNVWRTVKCCDFLGLILRSHAPPDKDRGFNKFRGGDERHGTQRVGFQPAGGLPAVSINSENAPGTPLARRSVCAGVNRERSKSRDKCM